MQLVRRAQEYSSLTGGAFDITVAPLLELYESRFWGAGVPPQGSEVEEALMRVGYSRLRIEESTIAFDGPGMSITLDGIAKGYIVDRAVRALMENGADRVIVDGGGDIASGGRGTARDQWRVGIQDPRRAEGVLHFLDLRGECVATSGDYVQTFTEDRRLHHIVDPRTGRSPDHTSGVTVVAPAAMDADALSTAVFILGPADGLDLLERLQDVDGMIITKEQQVFRTAGFDRYQNRL